MNLVTALRAPGPPDPAGTPTPTATPTGVCSRKPIQHNFDRGVLQRCLARIYGITYVIAPRPRACCQMSCRIREGVPRASGGGELAGRLYEWRRKNDLSQSEAAVKLRISARTLQEWDQNRARPRGLALAAINQVISA